MSIDVRRHSLTNAPNRVKLGETNRVSTFDSPNGDAMARNRLTDRMVRQARPPAVLIDGNGLRLRVSANPKSGQVRKSWLLRVTVKGAGIREIGLGSADDWPLALARDRAAEARRLARDGIDPIVARDAERAARAAEAARAMTFRQCAEAYIEAHRAGWRNAKHATQWVATLEAYAYPVFGDFSVQAVEVSLVMKALEPIWNTKTETATRVRQRIEAVLNWAKARGYRQGENPAQWRGHLQNLLPARAKVRPVRHHAALPYGELPAFMTDLRTRTGDAARAFEFAILTAARTNETLEARWSEFDLAAKVWTIPRERMKAGREHRVPLAPPVLAILRAQREAHPASDFVFPGASRGKPLSSMALLMMLRRMERTDLTAHGFRSTFRVWAAEQTSVPREIAEGALAHVLADKVEAAYRRTDLFDKRRKLMEAWARFCSPVTAKGDVVSIASARGRKRAEV